MINLEQLKNETNKAKVERLKAGIKKTFSLLRKRNLHSNESYNIKQINDIVYNEKAHVVACFKDFLIFDDSSEFLKRYYKSKEIEERLPRLYDYYENYSSYYLVVI